MFSRLELWELWKQVKECCVSKEIRQSFFWTTSDTTSRVRIELLWINGFRFYDVAYEFPISPSSEMNAGDLFLNINHFSSDSLNIVCVWILHLSSIAFGFKWKRNGGKLSGFWSSKKMIPTLTREAGIKERCPELSLKQKMRPSPKPWRRCDNKLFSGMIFLLFNVVSSFLSLHASEWVTYCMCRQGL